MLVLLIHFNKKCVDYYLGDVGVYHDVGDDQVVVIHVWMSVQRWCWSCVNMGVLRVRVHVIMI